MPPNYLQLAILEPLIEDLIRYLIMTILQKLGRFPIPETPIRVTLCYQDIVPIVGHGFLVTVQTFVSVALVVTRENGEKIWPQML